VLTVTNEELLEIIDVELRGPSDDCWHEGAKALRAVVTLCNFLDGKGRCCVPVQEIIDAIKKELE
jgi:NTP pyrophosphatase (non-canonical NTP hydrolase)